MRISQVLYSNRKVGARRAAVVPMVAIMLPVLLVLASFVINLSYMELSRTELRIASDSATRAAGHKLALTGDQAVARQAAREAGNRNLVAGEPLLLDDKDFEFGVSVRLSEGDRYAFTPGGTAINAVRLNARRTSDSASGAVEMVFPTFGAVDSFGPSQLAIASQVELDIALVLDRSGSMAYGDNEDSVARATAGLGPAIAPPGWWFGDPAPPKSRWIGLANAVQVFLDILNKSPQDEHVSLVTYNSKAKTDQNLTTDYSLILKALDVYTKKMEAGATNIHSGIQKGLRSTLHPTYARKWAAKVLIVLTDGKHNTGKKPESAAAKAFKDGIVVYTITFSNDAEQKQMIRLSKKGGGKHFHAASQADLQRAFEDIASSLPTLLTQ